MDWIDEEEWELMQHIVALLVSLAGLAERAAGFPLVIRLPVLLVLGRAEAIVRSRLLGLPRRAAAPADAADLAGCGMAERLAARLLALAEELAAPLAEACRGVPLALRRARLRAVYARAFREVHALPACPPARNPAPDTS